MSIGKTRVGVYVDTMNISRNGGYGMQYNVLRDFACRGDAEPVRLNAYVMFDQDRADDEPTYGEGQMGFYSLLRDFGYKVIQKNLKWHTDEWGSRFAKASTEMDMALDVVLQAKSLDRVVLATADPEFDRVITLAQNQGSRVEVVAFDNVPQSLRTEADLFLSGYLIPDLLPTSPPKTGTRWGDLGSRVRGVCYSHLEKGYGFLRFIKCLSPALWRIDARESESPYFSVFFHDSQLPPDVEPEDLPSRSIIFEFELAKSESRENSMIAINMQVVGKKKRERPLVKIIDADRIREEGLTREDQSN
ncbi:MAG TPA: NYN domain-containing protein [Bacteroidota bacterium]|nr:NYN domain-containing protein [Bacteroidota bacterium]